MTSAKGALPGWSNRHPGRLSLARSPPPVASRHLLPRGEKEARGEALPPSLLPSWIGEAETDEGGLRCPLDGRSTPAAPRRALAGTIPPDCPRGRRRESGARRPQR